MNQIDRLHQAIRGTPAGNIGAMVPDFLVKPELACLQPWVVSFDTEWAVIDELGGKE